MSASTEIVGPGLETEDCRVERTFERVVIVSRDLSARRRLSAAAAGLAPDHAMWLELVGIGSSRRALAKNIARRVKDWNADLVVLTVDDARIAAARFLAGGSAVLVVPPAWPPRGGLAQIAVGYDGGEPADAAIESVRELTAACHGSPRVELVHADDSASAVTELDADVVLSRRTAVIRWWLACVAEAIPAPVDVARHPGDPVAVLGDRSSDVDLLVVGTHGHGALRRRLRRSISQQLIATTRCPLLIVPRRSGSKTRPAHGRLQPAGPSPALATSAPTVFSATDPSSAERSALPSRAVPRTPRARSPRAPARVAVLDDERDAEVEAGPPSLVGEGRVRRPRGRDRRAGGRRSGCKEIAGSTSHPHPCNRITDGLRR